jgi:uncharacterized membrane protein YccC
MPFAAVKYRSEAKLVLRALVAAALSLWVGELFALPQSFWAVITSLIVVQGSVGGTLAAGLNRLLGTLAGAAMGCVAAFVREFWDPPQTLLLLLAVAPVALLAAIRPSFRVAPLTAAIVLFANNGAAPFASAMDRVLEITVGTIIGILVSILVLPSRAKQICFEHAAEVLKLEAQILTLHLQPPAAKDQGAVDRLGAELRAELAKVETAADEADRELAIRLPGEPVPDRLVRGLRRLRSDVAFVGRATSVSDLDWKESELVLGDVAKSFAGVFEAVAEFLLRKGPAPDAARLDPAIARMQLAFEHAPDATRASRSATILPFVVDTLRRDLADLIDARSAGVEMPGT